MTPEYLAGTCAVCALVVVIAAVVTVCSALDALDHRTATEKGAASASDAAKGAALYESMADKHREQTLVYAKCAERSAGECRETCARKSYHRNEAGEQAYRELGGEG